MPSKTEAIQFLLCGRLGARALSIFADQEAAGSAEDIKSFLYRLCMERTFPPTFPAHFDGMRITAIQLLERMNAQGLKLLLDGSEDFPRRLQGRGFNYLFAQGDTGWLSSPSAAFLSVPKLGVAGSKAAEAFASAAVQAAPEPFTVCPLGESTSELLDAILRQNGFACAVADCGISSLPLLSPVQQQALKAGTFCILSPFPPSDPPQTTPDGRLRQARLVCALADTIVCPESEAVFRSCTHWDGSAPPHDMPNTPGLYVQSVWPRPNWPAFEAAWEALSSARRVPVYTVAYSPFVVVPDEYSGNAALLGAGARELPRIKKSPWLNIDGALWAACDTAMPRVAEERLEAEKMAEEKAAKKRRADMLQHLLGVLQTRVDSSKPTPEATQEKKSKSPAAASEGEALEAKQAAAREACEQERRRQAAERELQKQAKAVEQERKRLAREQKRRRTRNLLPGLDNYFGPPDDLEEQSPSLASEVEEEDSGPRP